MIINDLILCHASLMMTRWNRMTLKLYGCLLERKVKTFGCVVLKGLLAIISQASQIICPKGQVLDTVTLLISAESDLALNLFLHHGWVEFSVFENLLSRFALSYYCHKGAGHACKNVRLKWSFTYTLESCSDVHFSLEIKTNLVGEMFH